MHISELVFKKKKIFYFLLVSMVVGGLFSFLKLSKLEDPEITVMIANVITIYPGASAHEVEMKVTNVLEDEIAALADLNKIESRSEANVSIISVELKMTVPQKEIPQRWEFLRRKLDLAMMKMPEGVRKPIVIDDVGDVYGMFYAMVADEGFSYKEMSDYADFVKRNMLEVEGVRKVSIYGEQKPEISITLTTDKMAEMGIMPMQIFTAIYDQTKTLYAGTLQSGEQEIRVAMQNKEANIEDIKNIYIPSLSGSPFKLGDIAKIELTYNEPLKNTLFVNNQKAIGIAMSMQSGENIVKVGEKVEKELDKIKQQIPAGISFEKVFFQPEKVEKSVKGFMWNLVMSVLIVIVVLMFTMGFRGGLIIGSGLVITIFATFPLLLVAGGTLQRISLGAFIVAMGMLVDNAIVVLDGILIEKGKGKKGKKVFTKTAKQTALPLLGATLIAIVAFLPAYLSPDTAGTYVRDLFVVLAISLFISWILALTQVPLFAASAFKKNVENKQNKEIYNSFWYRIMKKLLRFSMNNRALTIALASIVLIITIFCLKFVDKTFFPDFNYNQCYIEHILPKGSNPEMVNKNLAKITDYFNSFEEVEMVTSSHGMTPMRYCLVRGMMTENADNYGELIVNFKDYETMLKMRPIFNEYLRKEFPEALSRIRKYTLNVKSAYSLEAEFTGPDPRVLKELSEKVKSIMLNNTHTDKYTISDNWSPKTKILSPIYNEIAANRSITTRNDVSNAILAATEGLPIGDVYDGETHYTLRFKLRDKDGKQIEDLNDIPVWNTIPNIKPILSREKAMQIYSGSTDKDELMKELITSIPLSAVTNGVKLAWEEPVVRRLDGKRVIHAQCDPLDGYSSALVQSELDKEVKKIKLPQGYEFKWVGESELKTDALKNIFSFLPISAGIIILILLLLFNDYKRPLIVLLCLPMTVVGIVFGLLITKQPFSFVAIIGVIGLAGMIIKNAIVLLDEINIQLKKNKSPYQAVSDATISRVRPVLMASLTTILGMIPLLPDPMYGSMAVAIIAGLIVGTVITLIFVPIMYSTFYKVKIEKHQK